MTLTREQEVLLWTIGALAGLSDLGLVNGPPALTPKGTGEWDQLDAAGFRPTNDELGMGCKSVTGGTDDGMLTLLREFRDNRKNMEADIARMETTHDQPE